MSNSSNKIYQDSTLLSQILNDSTKAIYNASQLYNEPILYSDLVSGDVLVYNGSIWTNISISTAINPSPSGPVSPEGPTGPTGNEGSPGIMGPPGNEGPPGIMGPPGNEGPPGIMGPLGNEGPPGIMGPPGNEGPPGIMGPPGNEGPPGNTGDPGPPGNEGPTGPAGNTKPAVACYTTLESPLDFFTYNGSQQLTINVTATPIDGYTLQLNDRVLINCSNQAASGVYIATQLASPITFVRSVDANGSPLGEFQQGSFIYVINGTVYGGSLFVQTSKSPEVIGTSPIVYSKYSAAKNISAGANIMIAGNQVAVSSSLQNITSVSGLMPPVNVDDAVNKSYVDNIILTTKEFTSTRYVPLISGTLTNSTLAGSSSTITGTLTCTGNGKITGVPTPIAANDAVPKSYVDLLVAGVTFKPAVACYTTLAPGNLFPNVYNGDQQLTINVTATPIDGYTLQLNDRVLINCSNQAANGVYLVTQVAAPIKLVRAADLDGSPLSEFQQGALFYVTNGTIYGGSLFVQSSATPAVLGTSPIVYSQYSAAKNIAAGANIAITGNSVAVAPALTGITGVGLSANDGSAGVVTVGKASGAASYAVTLPSAAPAANTYLQYTGSSYAWSAAAGGSGVVAAQYLFANDNAGQSINGYNACPYKLSFPNVIAKSGIAHSTSPVNTFTLPAGSTYILRCELIHVTNAAVYRWADVTTGTNILIGSAGCRGDTLNINGSAIAYITTTVPTNVAVFVIQVNGTNITTIGADGNWMRFSWVSIEQISNNNAITAFTGANATTAGTLGYLPAPPVNSQNCVLTGAGTWQLANVGSTTAQYMHMCSVSGNTFNAGSAVMWNRQMAAASPGGAITYNSSNYTFTLLAGYTYKLIGCMPAAYGPTGTARVNYQWYIGSAPGSGDAGWVGNGGGVGVGSGNIVPATLAVAFVTASTNKTVWLTVLVNAFVPGFYNDQELCPWCTIEAVCNNAIVPFGGSTSAANGTLGGVPAPTAGQQNYYLQGNGSWSAVPSGSGAVAGSNGAAPAQYYMTIQSETVTVTLGQLIPFSITPIAFSQGTPIKQISTTQFQLLVPGCTYKLTAALMWCDTEVEYRWYDYTNSNALGVAGSSTNAASPMSVTAFAYVKPTTIINVGVIVTVIGLGRSTVNSSADYIGTGRAPWATIEVVNSSTSYYMTTQTAEQTATPNVLFPFLTTPMIYTGSAITQPTPTQFQLLAGYTYKLTAALMYSLTGNTVYRWYNNTNSSALGVAGSNSTTNRMNGTAVAYVTPTATITVGLMIQSSAAVTLAASVGGLDGRMSWAAIEVVNSNNAYYMTTQTASQNTSPNLIVPFLTTPMSSSAGTNITQSSAEQFRLLAGYTYKLTAALNYTPDNTCYQWYDITNSKKIGVGTNTGGNIPFPHNGTAIAYVTPAATINVGIIITVNNFTIAASTSDGRMSWATIEMIGNVATAPFTGATASTDGLLGMVPAPLAGDQTKFLCGNGSWATAGGIGATKLGLGMTGETYNDVTSQRTPTTVPQPSPTYINDRTYPIMVIVGFMPTEANNKIEMHMTTNGYNNSPWMVVSYINGANIGRQTMCSSIILPNQRYWPGVFGGTYNLWVELY